MSERTAYEKGDIRNPNVPGGNGGKPQNKQTPDKKRERKLRHTRNKAEDNRKSRMRYHRKYKYKRKMVERLKQYKKNLRRYRRRPPVSREAVAQRYAVLLQERQAGDVILYDQQNPANNEIKQPGKDVNYRAEGPTTFETSPDEKSGEPPGQRVPNRHLDRLPPASSKVIPEQMKETLQENLTYAKGAAPRRRRRRRDDRVSKHLVLNKIYEQLPDREGIEYDSAHVISEWGDREWLVSYITYTGKVRKVLVGGHETSPGRVYLSFRPFNTRQAALLSEIMGNCGPKIRERARGIQFNRVRINPEQGLILYDVRGEDGNVYRVRLKGERKGNVKALAKMPIKVSCSCPAFRWQGPEHWAKKNRYLFGKPVGSASKPVIRDPKSQHWACKHVYAVLDAKRGLRFARSEPYVGRVVSRYLEKR
jgi:hypothetical protein